MLKGILVILAAALLGVTAGWGIQYARGNHSDAATAHGESTTAILRSADYGEVMNNASAPVVLYTLSGCPYCKKAIAFLEERKVAFQIRELDSDAELAAEAKALGSTRVPFFVFREDSMEGFDERELTRLLAKYKLPQS